MIYNIKGYIDTKLSMEEVYRLLKQIEGIEVEIEQNEEYLIREEIKKGGVCNMGYNLGACIEMKNCLDCPEYYYRRLNYDERI